jgi:LPXTG-motif cell wall-anchored protein
VPCYHGSIEIEIDKNEMLCDGTPNSITWNEVKVENPQNSDFIFTVYDASSGEVILESSEPATLYDLSGISSEYKHIKVKAEINDSGEQWTEPFEVTVSWIENNANFCFQSKLEDICNIGTADNQVSLNQPSIGEMISIGVNNNPEICTPPPLPRTGGAATILLLTAGTGALVFGGIGGYWLIKRQKEKNRGF